MTDETRAELRRGLEMLLAYAASLPADPERPGYADVRHNTRHVMVEVWLPSAPQMHHLTTAQQLALSVLLGDDIPLGVLLSACEDAGVFADGLAGEIAEKARAEERERCAIAAMMLTFTRADELRAGLHNPLYSTEAVALDDHADWLRDRMMERA